MKFTALFFHSLARYPKQVTSLSLDEVNCNDTFIASFGCHVCKAVSRLAEGPVRSHSFAVRALFVCLFYASCSSAQTATTLNATSQAVTIMQNTMSALSSANAINDITLSGTALWIVGSDNETGSVTYRAVPAASRLDLNLSNGLRSENRSSGANGLTGAWVGPDGIVHPIASHNLLVDSAMYPTYLLRNFLTSSNSSYTYVGSDSLDGITTLHVSASQQFPDIPGNVGATLQSLSQVDIYLDPSSFLPAAIAYNSHPDDDAFTNIQTKFRFSDYRNVSGAQIPFHIQKFLNGSLTLDFQVQSVSVNTGLNAAQLGQQ